MRKILVIFIALMLSQFAIARPLIDAETYQSRNPWQVDGNSLSVAYGVLTSFDYTTVDAITDNNCVTITIPDGWAGIEFAFVIKDGNENDVDVLEAYAGMDLSTTGGFYFPIASLTITQGTALYSTGYYFADTVADSNNYWYDGHTDTMSPPNQIGRFVMNTFGTKKIIFTASTLVTHHEIYVWYRRY